MFGRVIRRVEQSTLRVVMKLKMKGKRPRGRPRLRSMARQHRQPPERKEHTERSSRNEMFRNSNRLEDIDFVIN